LNGPTTFAPACCNACCTSRARQKSCATTMIRRPRRSSLGRPARILFSPGIAMPADAHWGGRDHGPLRFSWGNCRSERRALLGEESAFACRRSSFNAQSAKYGPVLKASIPSGGRGAGCLAAGLRESLHGERCVAQMLGICKMRMRCAARDSESAQKHGASSW